MKNIKSLKSQLILQFAIIILPVLTILLYQTFSDIYQDEELARSYRYFGVCQDIKSKFTQFINGAVDAVDTGQLGIDALLALEEATEKLGLLAQEDHAGNFVKLQGTMDNLVTALRHDRSITTLVPLRELINRADADLGNEYTRYEKGNRQAIEANIAFAKIQKRTVLGAIFVTLFLSMIVGRSMTRSITRPITEAVAFAQSVILEVTEFTQGNTLLAQDSTTKAKIKATGEVQMLVDSINRMADDLEKRNRELFAAQEELVRKEKLAMLGLIAEGMGNELRNPLGVMSNAVFFLKSVLADDDKRAGEYLDIIKDEIDSSQRIVSDLVDFSGSTSPKAEPIVFDQFIRKWLGRCAIPENIRLGIDLPETSLIMVKVDLKQMEEVLRNLVTNAIQAMPDGGSLRIKARLAGAGHAPAQTAPAQAGYPQGVPLQDFLEISVTDTGAGIAPENMKKLFQPLFTTKSRGIGLGLAISQKFIEANGGRIGVESTLGKGTTLVVTLPVMSVSREGREAP